MQMTLRMLQPSPSLMYFLNLMKVPTLMCVEAPMGAAALMSVRTKMRLHFLKSLVWMMSLVSFAAQVKRLARRSSQPKRVCH